MAKEELQRATPFGALATRPDFIKAGDVRGAENIGTDDIKPPALKLAQSTSKETKRHEPEKYIEGLREGELFNSLTKEIYGEGPLRLVIVAMLGHRHVEFDPNDKNIVLDFNVPDGDPRTDFTNEVKDGKRIRVKPKATKFYDYLVYVVHADRDPELMALSFKSTQLKKAVDLNTLLGGLKMPTFAVSFSATVVPERRKDHAFYGWRLVLEGYVTPEIYKAASDTYDQIVKGGKKIVLETEGEGGEVDDEGGEVVGGVGRDKVPF